MSLQLRRPAQVCALLTLALFLTATALAQGFDRRDVSITSQGLKLAAWYYVPKGLKADEQRPAIVMAHGFSAPKEALLQNFADRFAAAGFVVGEAAAMAGPPGWADGASQSPGAELTQQGEAARMARVVAQELDQQRRHDQAGQDRRQRDPDDTRGRRGLGPD